MEGGRRRRKGRLGTDYVESILSHTNSSSSEDADERSIPPGTKGDGEGGLVCPRAGWHGWTQLGTVCPQAPLHPSEAVWLLRLRLRWIDW